MTRILLALVLAASSACATTEAGDARSVGLARPDTLVTRMIPTLHSIAPTRPGEEALREAALPAKSTGARRFAADDVAVFEPGFDERHSLAWERDVQAYTADVLARAAAPLPEGAPLRTQARFTWTYARRDGPFAGRAVTVDLETLLPDGRVVTSAPVQGPVVLLGETGIPFSMMMLGMGGASATLGAMLVLLTVGAPLTPVTALIAVVPAALGLVSLGYGVYAEIAVPLAARERWSDLYLRALRAHAADVRRVLVEDGVPR